MQRLLIFIGLLAVAWWMLRSIAPATRRRPQIGRDRGRERFADRSTAGEDLIACAVCGVYLPRRRALMHEGNLYCSAACRNGGAERTPSAGEAPRERPR